MSYVQRLPNTLGQAGTSARGAEGGGRASGAGNPAPFAEFRDSIKDLKALLQARTEPTAGQRIAAVARFLQAGEAADVDPMFAKAGIEQAYGTRYASHLQQDLMLAGLYAGGGQ